MLRMPLPLPRSSTRSFSFTWRSSSVSAARVEPCSPLPNAVSGIEDDARTAAGRLGEPGGRQREPAELPHDDAVTPRRAPVHLGHDPMHHRHRRLGEAAQRAVEHAGRLGGAGIGHERAVVALLDGMPGLLHQPRAEPAARLGCRIAPRWPPSSCAQYLLDLATRARADRLGGSPSCVASSRKSRSCSSVRPSGVHTCTRT